MIPLGELARHSRAPSERTRRDLQAATAWRTIIAAFAAPRPLEGLAREVLTELAALGDHGAQEDGDYYLLPGDIRAALRRRNLIT